MTQSQTSFPGKPKLLDQLRTFMRARRYSLRTEEAYLDWIRRFILSMGSVTRATWANGRSPNFSRRNPLREYFLQSRVELWPVAFGEFLSRFWFGFA